MTAASGLKSPLLIFPHFNCAPASRAFLYRAGAEAKKSICRTPTYQRCNKRYDANPSPPRPGLEQRQRNEHDAKYNTKDFVERPDVLLHGWSLLAACAGRAATCHAVYDAAVSPVCNLVTIVLGIAGLDACLILRRLMDRRIMALGAGAAAGDNNNQG